MLFPGVITTNDELEQILHLQQQNLKQNIGEREMKEQGFVTLQHDLQTLQQMNALAPAVIIKDDDKIVAYALSMLRECRLLIPDLEPMFALLDSVQWNSKPLSAYRYYVMGQVCIAKSYRGQGLFEALFQHHKKIYSSRFDLFITEISTSNRRSIRAHEKTGFRQIHTHRDELDEWSIVGWDWS